MISIYQESQALRTILEGLSPISQMNREHVAHTLHFAKFFLTNVKKTCETILKGRLSQLDPIVGENSCQIRGLVAITAYRSYAVKIEAQKLEKQSDILLQRINKHRNKLPNEPIVLSARQALSQLGLALGTSEMMNLLLKAHLLTIGKYFYFNAGGNEVSGISENNVREKLSRQLNIRVVKEIIHQAREAISVQSIQFLKQECGSIKTIDMIGKKYIRTIEVKPFHFSVSCLFYNFKTILLHLSEIRVPILLKEYGHKRGYFYRTSTGELPTLISQEELPLKPGQSIFVLECKFNKEIGKTLSKVNQIGVFHLALANAALLNQYSNDNDISLLEKENQNEIRDYKLLGQELCQGDDPSAFSIVHTHAATVREEELQ